MKKPYFYDKNKITQAGKIKYAKDIAEVKVAVLKRVKKWFEENPLAEDVYCSIPYLK